MDRAKLSQNLAKAFKALGQPPETLFDLFDRLEIPWSKTTLPISMGPGEEPTDTSCVIIKWDDLLAGEKRNQDTGPMIARVLTKAELQELAEMVSEANRSNPGISSNIGGNVGNGIGGLIVPKNIGKVDL